MHLVQQLAHGQAFTLECRKIATIPLHYCYMLLSVIVQEQYAHMNTVLNSQIKAIQVPEIGWFCVHQSNCSYRILQYLRTALMDEAYAMNETYCPSDR